MANIRIIARLNIKGPNMIKGGPSCRPSRYVPCRSTTIPSVTPRSLFTLAWQCLPIDCTGSLLQTMAATRCSQRSIVTIFQGANFT